MAKTNVATVAATVTATLTDAAVRTMYAEQFKGWSVKTHGEKPNLDDFTKAHQLGAKPGTKTAFAIAMYLRDEGITQGQMANALGGPYLNKARDLVNAKLAVRVPMAAINGHTCYKLALPAPKADKPAKAASKPKGKQAGASKSKADKADDKRMQAALQAVDDIAAGKTTLAAETGSNAA